MIRLALLADIDSLYAARGGLHYGEGVTQLEHALQCATLAAARGGAPGLVAAALLHDIGHLVVDDEHLSVSGIDDRHEATGADALAGLFGPAVRAPIALHVAAKRYLCFSEPDYMRALSPASRHSLALQGGPFGRAEAERFEQLPYCREAVALRRFDDMGKTAETPRRTFADHVPLLASLITSTSAA